MRRLAVAAMAALAACSVKLEGAPCTSDGNCPDSQRCDGAGAQPGRCIACVPDPACGADGTFCVAGDDTLLRACSTNVGGCRYSIVTACATPQVCQGTAGSVGCGCPPIGSSLGDRCTSAGTQACDPVSRNALVCESQGTCQVWVAAPGTSCTSQGLVCYASGGSAVCVCDAYSGTDLYADPFSGSPASAAVRPTGAQAPAACRFKSLTDALARASAGSTVRMTGWTSTSGAVAFSSASGETFPLVVNPGVTLATTDSSPVPAHYLIEVDQAGAMRPVLELDHDTTASGFTVQPATGGSASEALLVSCAAAGTNAVALSDLVLDGKGSLGASTIGVGLRLVGPCSVTAGAVTAKNATGAGILVQSLNPPTPAPACAISIAGCTMQGNGDSGLVVDVNTSNGLPSLLITGNDLTANRASTAYSDSTTSRRGGGVVLKGAAPSPLAFTGNQVHGNSYDQVLVWSSGTWDISGGTACGTTSNNFTCYDAANVGVGLSALGGARVTAGWEYWTNSLPVSGTDFQPVNASTITVSSGCSPNPLTCP